MSQLGKELSKLFELAPQPIDLSFLVGYIACALPSYSPAFPFRAALKDVISFRDDSLITQQNILEMMVVLNHKIIKSDPKQLVTSINHYAGELICDNKYLFSRFFQEKVVEQKENEGLGIQCSICTVEIDAKNICYLSCNHMYHKECFKEYSKEQIAKKSIPLKCPTEECHIELSNQQIRQFLPKDLKDKYEEFMFQNYVDQHMVDTSWCPTPGCKAVFAFDQALDNYRCPSCSKHYCLRCKCEMHVGITCKEYQELGEMSETDKKFMVLVKGSKYKQCPNCKFWVQKNQGCDHMTCRCKYQFCYICGGKYGECSCVGAPRNLFLPRPRHMPMPVPMPIPQPRRNLGLLPMPQLVQPHPAPIRPRTFSAWRPGSDLDQSDEQILPLEIYSSVSQQSRRQQEQLQRLMERFQYQDKEEREILQAINRSKIVQQQIKPKRQQIKRQRVQQIKEEKKQEIKGQSEQKIENQGKVKNPYLLQFGFRHQPKPKQPKREQ